MRKSELIKLLTEHYAWTDKSGVAVARVGEMSFYRHPDGRCNCADGGIWVSALFESPVAAASWSDDFGAAEEMFRKLNPPDGPANNYVPVRKP